MATEAKFTIKALADEALPTFSAMYDALGKLASGSITTDSALKTLGDGVKKLGGSLLNLAKTDIGEALKGIGKTEISLDVLKQGAMALGQVFKAMGGAIVDSLKRSAEDGDKGAQALLGGFEKIKKVIDDLVQAFVRDFAPAILPVVNLFADLAKQVADWAAKSGAGKSIAQTLVSVVLTLGTAFESMISIAISGFVKIIQLGADASSIFDHDLANSMDGMAKKVGDFGKAWDATAAGIETKLAQIEKGQADLTKSQVDGLAALSDAAEKHDKEDAKRAEAASKAKLEAQQKANEEAKAALDEAHDLIQQGLDEALEAQQDADATEIEALEAKNAAKLEADRAYQQALQESAQLSADTSEELAARMAEIDQTLANDASLSAEVRIDAQKRIADATRKANDDIQKATAKTTTEGKKQVSDLAKATTSAFTSMFSIAVSTSMTGAEKLKAIQAELTKAITGYLQQKAQAWMAAAAQEQAVSAAKTAAMVAGEATEKTAAISSLGAKVASAFASLGPFGPPLAAAALAAFQALISRALKFEEGGSVAGRVPGMGRQDTVPIRANAREAVLNERATEGLGQKVIDALNRNGGRMPEAAAAAPGAPQEILVTVRYEAPQERAFARALMSLITVEVRRFGAELEASHLRRS